MIDELPHLVAISGLTCLAVAILPPVPGPVSRSSVLLLGPLEVWRDGERLQLGGVKQRALLAHLALHANTAVSLDQLVEILWPVSRPRSVVANLRTYVWQLRQLLDEQLRTQGTGYVL